ncbi:addiction module toxin, RelE/StbE family protein (plasmid) [Methanococcus maripaludis KA1]|uniref:Addiction module toxin, RelE/StbE family protein n=1 Tax=Methanococcus maripaludis KA1 TaxID=637914 RepID=A0A2Z5PIR9_METMI|nr:type II toxin-antitoxin system RelE/ParE family toxin [Methanococcus maripaludis]BAP62078.1 addiction module toxin, RelE/StbE family protein [Methanococcus maripaludis KA1]
MELQIENKKVFNKIQKIVKGDKAHGEALNKAFKKLMNDPYMGKPLRNKLKGTYRIHVYSSFVLIYEICEDTNIVNILEYDHHDKVY